MTFTQKVGRVFLVTITLLLLSIVSAFAVAVLLFLVQRFEIGRAMSNYPIGKIIAVLLDSLLVNVVCVFILLQIKKLDQTLVPPSANKTLSGK